MHKLGLLPAALLRTEAEPPEAAAARLPKALPPNRSGSSGVLYRALTSLISIDGSEAAAPEVSQREAEAIARTRACVEACRIDEVRRSLLVCLTKGTLARSWFIWVRLRSAAFRWRNTRVRGGSGRN